MCESLNLLRTDTVHVRVAVLHAHAGLGSGRPAAAAAVAAAPALGSVGFGRALAVASLFGGVGRPRVAGRRPVRGIGHGSRRSKARISSSAHWALTSSSTSSPTSRIVSDPRDDDVTLPHERHHGGAAGQADRAHLALHGRRAGLQRHLHQPGVAAVELQEADQHPDRDGLLYEAGEQLRRRDGHVHAPHLVEEPVVLGVVHPGDHPRHGELLLGEKRDDEVVLVVARRRHYDVHLVEMGCL